MKNKYFLALFVLIISCSAFLIPKNVSAEYWYGDDNWPGYWLWAGCADPGGGPGSGFAEFQCGWPADTGYYGESGGGGYAPPLCPGPDPSCGPPPIEPPPGAFTLNASACYGGYPGVLGYNWLTWTPSAGVENYQIWTKFASTGTWYHVGDTDQQSFETAQPTHPYGYGNWYFQVRATNGGGTFISNEVAPDTCPDVAAPVCSDTRFLCMSGTPINGSEDASNWYWLCRTSSADASCSASKAAPSCVSATPDDQYVHSWGIRRISVSGVTNTTSISFPTWSAVGGQDDLNWYSSQGINAGGGNWYKDIDVSDHPGDGYLYTHVYLNNANYSNIWCDAASYIKVPPPTDLSVSCAASGASCTALWSLPSGYSYSFFRVTDLTTGTSINFNTPEEHADTGSPYTFTTTPGHTYSWWVHTRAYNTPATWYDAYSIPVYGSDFTTPIPNPTVSSVTINNQDGSVATQVIPNNSTLYDIKITGTDTYAGGTGITDLYGLINYPNTINGTSGHTDSEMRGYLEWSNNDFANNGGTGITAYTVNCSGDGGKAALITDTPPYNVYGGTNYLTLAGCNSSHTATTRTAIFAVKVKPAYGTAGPSTNNDIPGYIRSGARIDGGWRLFNTDFAIAAMSGTFDGPGSCGIPNNSSTCNVTVSWSVTNPYSGTTQVKEGSTVITTSDDVSVAVPVTNFSNGTGSRTLTLNNNGTVLDTRSYTSGCDSGTAWDPVDSRCETIVTSRLVTITSAVIGGIVKSTSPSTTIDCVSPSDSSHNVCAANFNLNSTVTLTATPSSSYWRFSQWSNVGSNPVCAGSTNPSCSFVLDGDKTATALFVPRSFNYKEF